MIDKNCIRNNINKAINNQYKKSLKKKVKDKNNKSLKRHKRLNKKPARNIID